MNDSATAYQNHLSRLTDEALREEFSLMWGAAGGGGWTTFLWGSQVSKRDLLVAEVAYRWTKEHEVPDPPLRRCTRCGERVRAGGETVLCDGVVSKLAPLSVHEAVPAAVIVSQANTNLQSALDQLDRISNKLCEEANDIGQAAPLPPRKMEEFLCSCADEIRTAITRLGHKKEED